MSGIRKDDLTIGMDLVQFATYGPSCRAHGRDRKGTRAKHRYSFLFTVGRV